jgi:hypothetical protein
MVTILPPPGRLVIRGLIRLTLAVAEFHVFQCGDEFLQRHLPLLRTAGRWPVDPGCAFAEHMCELLHRGMRCAFATLLLHLVGELLQCL